MAKLLITQALDERGLVEKKILDKIRRAKFVSDSKTEYDEKDIVSEYQSIRDLITYYDNLNNAIIRSNATTKIVVGGKEMSVAEAISMRNRLRNDLPGSSTFEYTLCSIMASKLRDEKLFADGENRRLEKSVETMFSDMLSGEGDNTSAQIIEEYKNKNMVKVIDPLGVEKLVADIQEEMSDTLNELETQIKVSNATTTIEV